MAEEMVQRITLNKKTNCLSSQEASFQERKIYYQRQTRHNLDSDRRQLRVPIWIADEDITGFYKIINLEIHYAHGVNDPWKSYVVSAVCAINEATPGLHLHLVDDKESAKVKVYEVSGEQAFTVGCIQQGIAEIYYGDDWPIYDKEGASLHELMRALGFAAQEHRLGDAKELNKASKDNPQFNSDPSLFGITTFDSQSIMFCSKHEGIKRKDSSDIFWKLKPFSCVNSQLSELDKVGLNILYPPCKTYYYNPKISEVTGFYYCGRMVMEHHNYPAENITNGYCGPNNWANCPACRTLRTRAFDDIIRQGKWQGMSGLVYCGRHYGVIEDGHDGYCGPNNGKPCHECRNILQPFDRCTIS